MSNPTVPTPAPDEADTDRVAPCNPTLENDLGSIVIMCSCKRPNSYPWHTTYIDGGDEAAITAAFAGHRAECEGKG